MTTPAFARRLAGLLAARRRQRGCSLRALARQSHHAFTARDLRAYEDATVALDEEKVDVVADLYGIDLDEILVERVGLAIDPDGVLSTSGLDAAFLPHDDVSLLTAYLRLVRQMRAQQGAPTIQLRREDVEVLAEFIGESGPSVIERLGALMGATAAQRRAMAGMFLAGAVVIGLAGGTVTAMSAHGDGHDGSHTAPSATVPELTVVEDGTPMVAETTSTLPATTVPPPATVATTTTVPTTVPTTEAVAPEIAAPAGTATPATTPAPIASSDVLEAPPVLGGEIAPGEAGTFATDVPTQAAPIDPPTTTTGRVEAPGDTAPAAAGGDLTVPDLAVAAPPVAASTPPASG